jgi:glycosyltransferase involved in cell wall biosynthesis
MPRAHSARLPRGVLRLAHGMRYRAAGLRRVVREIAPDVFHAHYLVEHGFYGALAGVRPYVVTAWGSDALVEPQRDRLSKLIARWTIGRADLVTSNNAYMSQRIVALGAPAAKVETVTLGAERYDLERTEASVNRAPHDLAAHPKRTPVIVSTRAHEPLYNIGEIIDAHALLVRDGVDARLVIAHSGSLTDALRAQTASAPGAIEFVGTLDRAALRDLLADAEVFVSVPSSDATSVALLQAMAAGAFPIVSDLPTQNEWVEDGVNGFRVPLHRPDVLAQRVRGALADHDLRRRAAGANLRIVEQRGLNDVSMARMEELYRRAIASFRSGRS